MGLITLVAACDHLAQKIHLGEATAGKAEQIMHRVLVHTMWWGKWKMCKVRICSAADRIVDAFEDITDACVMDYAKKTRDPDIKLLKSEQRSVGKDNVIDAEFEVVK